MRFPRIRPFGFRFYTTEPNSFRNLPDRSNGSSVWLGYFILTAYVRVKSKPTDVHQNQFLDNMPQPLALIKE